MTTFINRAANMEKNYWKDYTICTVAKTYEIGQNRLKLAE